MPIEAILHEVEQLHDVSERLATTGGATSARVGRSHNDLGKRSQHGHDFGSAGRDKND